MSTVDIVALFAVVAVAWILGYIEGSTNKKMKPYSIVIPSKSIVNLTACVGALRAAGETARVIVVWDGDGIESLPWDDQPRCPPIRCIRGDRPFIFARNINIGIRAAWHDDAVMLNNDVVLLNDDCLLRTREGFKVLATQAHANREYGAICPGFDWCGTPNLVNAGRIELTEEKTMLVFACVFIPRSTIDRVGFLDERFGVNAGGAGKRGYGLEDDDYSLRIRRAGLKLGVYDPVIVHHTKQLTGLSSTFREDPEHPWDVQVHERLFQKEWGFHPRLQK